MSDSDMTFGEFEDWFESLSPEKKEAFRLWKNMEVSFQKFQSIDDKEKVYIEYKEMRDRGLSVVEAYELLYKKLEQRGKDPESYGLKGDPHSFNRAFNRYKNRRI